MSSETFNLKGLARYLGRDARDLEKLATQGRLPGQRVAGDWRFHRAEVNRWIEGELGELSDAQLERFETAVASNEHRDDEPFVVRALMDIDTSAVPLEGRTAQGVLRSLIEVANRRWQIYDPARVFEAVWEREQVFSTAVPGGVALPHPGRRLKTELADSLIVYGRTNTGIPFGGPKGQLTDIFFLVLCRDDRTHLQALARLSRIIQRAGVLDKLRHSESTADSLDLIEQVEDEVA